MTEALFVLYVLTALASAGNTAYFATLQTASYRRRTGTSILALVCGGTLAQSAVGAVGHWRGMTPSPEAAVLAQGIVTLGSIAIAAVILRRLLKQRGHQGRGDQ